MLPPCPHTVSLPLLQITELRQKLADLQKQVTELEAEREQKQRDFDQKLLLAKSKIEMEEASVTRLAGCEVPESLGPVSQGQSQVLCDLLKIENTG